jgi:phage terminase small subunit
MTPKQQLFCAEYLIDLNATQAAIRAGYSAKTAAAQASRLLTDVKVAAWIAAKTAERTTRLDLTAENVLRELSKIVFFDMDDLLHVTPNGDPYIDLSKASPATRGVLTQAEIEDFVDRRERDEEGEVVARDVRRVKIKGPDKLAAINTAMRHLGLLTEQLEIKDGGFADRLAEAIIRGNAARAG